MFFGSRTPEMVDPSAALPGRDTTMPVASAHLVFGTPMTPPFPENCDSIVVGMGCFWGAERKFWQLPGVYTTAVGYAGGYTPNPTYEETCSGLTGHTEVVLVVWDRTQTDLDAVLRCFWENHDPTQGHRQGNDIGTQYRSAIFCTDELQLAAAKVSAVRFGEICGVVFGSVIDNDHVEVGNSAFQFSEGRGKGLVFVERGNDDEHPVTIVGPVLHWL